MYGELIKVVLMQLLLDLEKIFFNGGSFMHDYEEIFAEDDNRALLDSAYDYYTELASSTTYLLA